MTLARVREMRSRMQEIESLERSGRFAEADLLWDDMFRIATSGKMVRTAFAEAGQLAKLFKWMLPMWREEVGGASRFIHPGKEVENVLRHVKAPFWQNETKIPWNEAWRHLEGTKADPFGMVDTPRDRMLLKRIMTRGTPGLKKKAALDKIGLTDEEKTNVINMVRNKYVRSEEEGIAMVFNSKKQDPTATIAHYTRLRAGVPAKPDIDEALVELKKMNGGDYASKTILTPGGKQRFQKGLVRNVAVPMGGYAGLHAAFGLDRNEGGPTPDQQFDPRMPGTSGRYYPKHLYRSETGESSYRPRPYSSGYAPSYAPRYQESEPTPSYEPTGYQPEYDAPDISQWDQGSVAGVVMDPYGRRITRTIPS